MRCIILVFCVKLICPTQHNRISREVGVVRNLDLENSGKMDFCQLVVDEIKNAAIKFHADGSKQDSAEACAVMPLVMYLDSVKCRRSLMSKDTPRMKYLDKRRLRDIMAADVIKKGVWGRLNVSTCLSIFFLFVYLFLFNYTTSSNHFVNFAICYSVEKPARAKLLF